MVDLVVDRVAGSALQVADSVGLAARQVECRLEVEAVIAVAAVAIVVVSAAAETVGALEVLIHRPF